MPKNKPKKKIPKNNKGGNANNPKEELTGTPAMMAAFKKVFPEGQCFQVDSSRGPRNAAVHLEPGV